MHSQKKRTAYIFWDDPVIKPFFNMSLIVELFHRDYWRNRWKQVAVWRGPNLISTGCEENFAAKYKICVYIRFRCERGGESCKSLFVSCSTFYTLLDQCMVEIYHSLIVGNGINGFIWFLKLVVHDTILIPQNAQHCLLSKAISFSSVCQWLPWISPWSCVRTLQPLISTSIRQLSLSFFFGFNKKKSTCRMIFIWLKTWHAHPTKKVWR